MSDFDLVVPAAEANRRFSQLLRAAREGKHVVITSHGAAVAELLPAGSLAKAAAERQRRAAAMAELEAHWETAKPRVIGDWTRADLYDRG
ncbi:MAG TPA: type II toxin-antitoxin system prevent-host-death family antitoxin [Caulobacteraceae bacterium]|jgi:prevent-host-death family protein